MNRLSRHTALQASAPRNLVSLFLTFLVTGFSAIAAEPDVELPAAKAVVNGSGAVLTKNGMIEEWSDAGTFVSWRVELPAGDVEVLVQQAAEEVIAGNTYQVEIDGQVLSGTVKSTGGWGIPEPVSLGKFKVKTPGEFELIVRPLKITRAVMNLKGILLRGPAAEKAKVITPPDLIRGEYFPKKNYVPEALPSFDEVKDRLPEPVFPTQPEWVEMYWKCWQLAFSHLKQPSPDSPLVSNWLDEWFSPNIFQWDSCFMMMFARYGHYEFPAIQSLDNFYCLQRPSGYICREYTEDSGREVHFGIHGLNDPTGWQNTINPPIFSWAECETFKITGDKSRFSSVLPVLEKYVAWLNREGSFEDRDVDKSGRRSVGTPHGLYWNTPLGSGMDNTPKPNDKGCGWVDMSCQMVMQYNDLATIYHELGLPGKAKEAKEEAAAIGKRINQWCWDETDGFYYDVDAEGTKFKKKTSCGFWPLIAGIASKSQAARLVEHLKNPDEFNRPFLFPTLAANEKEYQPTGGYWRGGVWAPTNYMIIKGLERYGYEDFAAESTEKYLASMARVFKETGTVWENYAPEFMKPGNPSQGDFVGWTGCGPISLFIENVLGFHPDGVRNILQWHLRIKNTHGIKRLQFGSVTTDITYDGKGTVEVKATNPFTLIINGKGFPIEAGNSRIRATP